MKGQRRFHLDVLAWRPLRAVVSWAGFPVILQAMGLLVVGYLAWNGLGIGLEQSAAELKTLRKTNLTTLVVWGLWWPGMIAVALLAGRLWCTVCPMELVNRVGDALARRVGWPRAPLARWLRAGWLIVAIYLLLQVLVIGVSIHRIPHYTAILLISLLGLALVTGLVFRAPRSFCRAFCPAGALLSVYGRFTPTQLEVCDPTVCDACPGRDCADPANRWRFDKRSCPSLLRPYARAASDGCVLCLQCTKSCPYDNLGFGVTRAEAPIRQKPLLKPFEAAFVLVVLGFVAHEATGEAKWLDAYFHRVPEALHTALPAIDFAWYEALWFLALFPAVVWALAATLAFVLGHRSGWRALLLAAATGAAPIVAIAHLAKGFAKISSWGGYLPHAVAEPAGVDTFREIVISKTIPFPGRLVALWVIGALLLAAALLIVWRSWRWINALPAGDRSAARAGLFTAAAVYLPVLFTWVAVR